jgi:hypothetical protein
MREGLG